MIEDPFSFSADKPVLVIGSSGVDIVGRLRSELHTDSSNPAHIRYSFGGVARNVAENLARLGQSVRLVSAIGEDDAAGRLLDVLVEAGVDVGAVLRTEEGNTGTYLAVFDQAGNRQFALDDMRIVSLLTSQYIRQYAHLFDDASLLFIDANLPKDTLRTVLSLARRAHLPVCADPTAALLAHRFQPYISRFFMITPNSSEASILCDPSHPVNNRKQALEAAKCLVSQGVNLAIITMAEQGLCYATSEVSGHIPALRTGVLDPTGAGDALSATVIFALLNGIQIDEAMRLGVSAASLTLRYRGAVVPDLSIEKLYDRLVV
jgi:pseudouridine kinase